MHPRGFQATYRLAEEPQEGRHTGQREVVRDSGTSGMRTGAGQTPAFCTGLRPSPVF